MPKFVKSTLEEATLDYLKSLGWNVAFGPRIAHGETAILLKTKENKYH